MVARPFELPLSRKRELSTKPGQVHSGSSADPDADPGAGAGRFGQDEVLERAQAIVMEMVAG